MRRRMRVLGMRMQVAVGRVMLVLVVGGVVVVRLVLLQLLVHVLLLVLWVMLLVVVTRWGHLVVVLLQLGFGKAPSLVLALQGSSSERWLLLLVVPQDVGLGVSCLVLCLPLLL